MNFLEHFYFFTMNWIHSTSIFRIRPNSPPPHSNSLFRFACQICCQPNACFQCRILWIQLILHSIHLWKPHFVRLAKGHDINADFGWGNGERVPKGGCRHPNDSNHLHHGQGPMANSIVERKSIFGGGKGSKKLNLAKWRTNRPNHAKTK